MAATARDDVRVRRVERGVAEDATIIHISDVETMRVCAHPVRSRIFRALRESGPLTASRLGESLGESSGLMSYHLRKLEQHGIVLEDHTRARGRERWWTLAADHFVFDYPENPSPEYTRVMQRIRGEIIDAGARALADFAADEVHYPREWREAATFVTDVIHVTPTEMSEISDQICDMLDPYHREQDDRPADALPVRFSIHAVPTRPPAQPATRRNRRRS